MFSRGLKKYADSFKALLLHFPRFHPLVIFKATERMFDASH